MQDNFFKNKDISFKENLFVYELPERIGSSWGKVTDSVSRLIGSSADILGSVSTAVASGAHLADLTIQYTEQGLVSSVDWLKEKYYGEPDYYLPIYTEMMVLQNDGKLKIPETADDSDINGALQKHLLVRFTEYKKNQLIAALAPLRHDVENVSNAIKGIRSDRFESENPLHSDQGKLIKEISSLEMAANTLRDGDPRKTKIMTDIAEKKSKLTISREKTSFNQDYDEPLLREVDLSQASATEEKYMRYEKGNKKVKVDLLKLLDFLSKKLKTDSKKIDSYNFQIKSLAYARDTQIASKMKLLPKDEQEDFYEEFEGGVNKIDSDPFLRDLPTFDVGPVTPITDVLVSSTVRPPTPIPPRPAGVRHGKNSF